MATRPTQGGNNGTWGTDLNAWLDVGHNTDGTLKTSALDAPITKRVETLADAATVTPNSDSYDGGKLTSLSQTTTIANPTGTPHPFQQYMLRIKSASSQTLNFGAQFRFGTDITQPAATTGGGKTDYLLIQWNADDSKWDLVGLSRGY